MWLQYSRELALLSTILIFSLAEQAWQSVKLVKRCVGECDDVHADARRQGFFPWNRASAWTPSKAAACRRHLGDEVFDSIFKYFPSYGPGFTLNLTQQPKKWTILVLLNWYLNFVLRLFSWKETIWKHFSFWSFSDIANHRIAATATAPPE